ncbi:hypothetical protein FJZ53_02110 [Candidatus Woesearchaeota archaeon]|nr:hypothetical protein [Candidatus Woesearchaeota archaeon]
MTICIAAICEVENSPQIVFTADRLISAGIQFEHGVSKIMNLTDNCWLMCASNDSLKSDIIINNVREKLLTNKPKIKEIAEIFSKECQKLMNDERETEVLAKFGLNYETFIKKSKELSQDLIRLLGTSLDNYTSNFETEFLILGLEPSAVIYVINQDGEYKPYDRLGFACIGSGSTLAFPEMTKYSYTPTLGLYAALIRVYQAKKVAQRVSGVGEYTDLLVLCLPEGTQKPVAWIVNPEIMSILDEGLSNIQRDELNNYGVIIKNIIEKLEELKKHEDIVKPIKDKMKKEKPSN